MKKIILILLLFLFSCGPTYYLNRNFDNYYIPEHIDSVCRVENIPINLNKWSKMTMFEDSTSYNRSLGNRMICKKLLKFIKDFGSFVIYIHDKNLMNYDTRR